MKEPWKTEDWHKAKGVVAAESDTNSALALRDYAIPCEDTPHENLITIASGYHIWWCSTHHQPRAWCRLARECITVQAVKEQLKGTCQLLTNPAGAETRTSDPGNTWIRVLDIELVKLRILEKSGVLSSGECPKGAGSSISEGLAAEKKAMTKEERQKLSEEIARWVGFSVRDYPEPKLESNEKAWFDPHGTFYSGLTNFIDFTGSLDACFAWPVPKALEVLGYKQWYMMLLGWITQYANCAEIKKALPAEYLCLAIKGAADKASAIKEEQCLKRT